MGQAKRDMERVIGIGEAPKPTIPGARVVQGWRVRAAEELAERHRRAVKKSRAKTVARAQLDKDGTA